MDDFPAELPRSSSNSPQPHPAVAAVAAVAIDSATETTTTTSAAQPASYPEYVDIDVSQPGDSLDYRALSPPVMRVEQRDDEDGEDGQGAITELQSDAAQHRRYQQQQQQGRLQWHEQQPEQPHTAPSDERKTVTAASSGGERQSSVLRRHAPPARVGESDDEEWAREDQEADYNDAVLSSRLDSGSAHPASNASTTSSSFSYSTLTSYLPASISSLPSSLSSSLPSSLSSLPSSLSSLPSTLSSLPSHLPSLASLSSLPSLPTTTASSTSPAPAPVVSFKSISSFTYASDVYYLLLLATSSSLVLYHLDPNPQPAPTHSSIAVKRVSAYHDEAMAHLSSSCFLTPSVSLLSSPDLLLPSPLTPPGHLGPLLALTSSASSASSSFPSSSVKIFSTFLSKAVHLLRFRSRVLRVVSSTSTFAVLLENEIVVYATPQSASIDELRFDLLYSVRCAGGNEYGVCALGPRWIAYASESLPASSGTAASAKAEDEDSPLLVATSTTPKVGMAATSSSPFALPASASSSMSSPSAAAASLLSSLPSSSDSLSTISRNIASSLYNLGDQGRRSISNYLTPLPAEPTSSNSSTSTSALSSPVSSSPSSSASASATVSAGTVIVRDVLTQRVLCHLKAHSSAIATLAFDPTGTLLVTAGQHGQYIHIYQLVTLPSSFTASSPPSASAVSASSPVAPLSSFSPRFLYRLFRGVTHATLRSLSFSSDSNWFACTSLKGTTHIFAINPHGGPINVSTHAPPPMPVRDERDERDEDGVSDHPLTLNAIHRIRGNFPSSASTSPVTSSFLHLALPSSTSHIDHLALLTSTAEVLLYRLSTVYRPPPPTSSNSLALLSSAQQHRRRKETVVGESDSIGQMMGGVVEGMGVVVGHVVHELSRAVQNYQSGPAPAPAYDVSAAATEEASQRKLDLLVTAVAHIHLATDVTDTDGLVPGSRRSRDNDNSGGGGHGGGGGTGGGSRERRLTANPNFFRDIEQQRHTHLSRSSGHYPASSFSSSSLSSQSHLHQAASAWLANVELRSYSTPDLPLWASPQFTLYTYAAPSPSPTAQRVPAFGSPGHAASSSSSASDSPSGAMLWYSEPSVSALHYDKYAGLASVRVFDGSSLGYTEVKVEEEQVEWSDSHIAQQQQHQPPPHPQRQSQHSSPHYSHSYAAAAEQSHQPAPTKHLAAHAASSSAHEGGRERGGGGGGRGSSSKSQVDEHKAAVGYGESGVSELLTRRVNRFAVNGVSSYSPPLSAISHRSLSPSAGSDRDSEEQMVM